MLRKWVVLLITLSAMQMVSVSLSATAWAIPASLIDKVIK